MKELKKEGKTILVVHHDLGKAQEYFDKLVMVNQTLVAFGNSDEVFTPEIINRTYGGRLTILQKTEELIS
jgi:ABC-type Mn2+/Zn2+ transport system ATPase subunit